VTAKTTASWAAAPASPASHPDESDGPTSLVRPRWGRWAQLSVAALAGVLYLSNLSANGLANPYYAAAVKSGSVSWKAFFFGSLDPGSFITVDKPPAAFWLQELSVRVFGYSSWSILVPEAVAGMIVAAVTYHLARRLVLVCRGAGAAPDVGSTPSRAEIAGVLAGLAMAVTPIAAVMFRFNDPEALLTLLLLLSTWAGWVAIERGSIRRLVLAGCLVGLAFLTKELVAAIVVPGLALAWIIAAPLPLRRRLLGWLWSGLTMVLSAGWWVAIVQLLPASDRPYIGSSTDNSILSVIFGYNGLLRLFGSSAGGGHTSGRAAAHTSGVSGGLSFGGGAGWTRLFSSTLGGQISWLLPLAAVGLVFGLVSAGRAPRSDLRRAGYILWGGWAAAAFVVFSKSSGTFHPYYVVAMAPPVALLAAVGVVDLWALGRRHRSWSWLLPMALAGSGAWAWALLARDASYHPWLRIAVFVAAIAAAAGLLAASLAAPQSGAVSSAVAGPQNGSHPDARAGRRRVGLLGTSAAVVAAVALLAGPTAWSLSSITHASNGDNPTAGPSSSSSTGSSIGGSHEFDIPSGAGGVPGDGEFSGQAKPAGQGRERRDPDPVRQRRVVRGSLLLGADGRRQDAGEVARSEPGRCQIPRRRGRVDDR
jgi:4-amino-4-deoxy-L-arabinose transferase-like glycosyltransferase